MNVLKFSKKLKTEKIKQELSKFDVFSVVNESVTILDLVMLNDIMENYEEFTKIETNDGVYRIYNYENLKRDFGKELKHDALFSKSKSRLEEQGFIKCKTIAASCPKLGFCRIAVKLNDKRIKEILK